MNLPFGRKPAPVNIQRECYAMATREGNSAEITMYGQIVERRPMDWWTGKPVQGNFIVKSEFLEDLKQIEGVRKLSIRLDSLGGDAYASLLIHNRLRELKAKKTVQVDGVAMSGGSIIMCAGDTVKVNPGSIIMVHKCMAFLFGYYNEDELEKVKQSNNAVDKALASVYTRKTGLTEEEAMEIMQNETYLTGEEAVAKGFADELMENEDAPQIAASADHSTLIVNGRALATMGYPLPEGIPLAPAAQAASPTTDEPPEAGGEGEEIVFSNYEELKAQNPELAESVLAEAKASLAGDVSAAVQAERNRLSEIDSIAGIYGDDLVHEAKYGEEACSAQELAYRAAQEAAKQGKQALQEMEADAAASGAQAVGAAPVSVGEKTELSAEERRAAGRADAKAMKKE